MISSSNADTYVLPTNFACPDWLLRLSVGRVERGFHSNEPSKSSGAKSVKNPLGSRASIERNVSWLHTGH